MTETKFSIGSYFLLSSLVVSLASSLSHAQTTSTWDGPASGSYDDAANWDPDGVPLNDGGDIVQRHRPRHSRPSPTRHLRYGNAINELTLGNWCCSSHYADLDPVASG